MKIIKRNGSEVPFDITKIITAVTKASDSVSRKSSLTQEQILSIATDFTEQCPALNRDESVGETVCRKNVGRWGRKKRWMGRGKRERTTNKRARKSERGGRPTETCTERARRAKV